MSHIIPPDLAAECVAQYQKLYQSDDIAAIRQAYTESVSFYNVAVTDFIDAAAAAADTDILEIKFGVYTENFVKAYPMVKLGRLTVFLFTKGHGLGDPPKDALNIGSSLP
jgi:hypothetical protein